MKFIFFNINNFRKDQNKNISKINNRAKLSLNKKKNKNMDNKKMKIKKRKKKNKYNKNKLNILNKMKYFRNLKKIYKN